MIKKSVAGIILLIISIPLLMWLFWFFTPKTNLVAVIVDKTVLTEAGQEHKSFTWILNNRRYTKTPTKPYSVSSDYYGFFPLQDQKFKIKGLERFSSSQLKQLSNDSDLIYVTDTYGIFNNEWFSGKNVNERSGMLYGGLSSRDVEFLELMKARKKLIIAEFNTIGSPTDSTNRAIFEENFAFKWTGWTARFFDKLDTSANQEIPRWLINDYKRSHNNKWPFKKSGIAFVSNNGEAIVLEEGLHLTNSMPYIVSNEYGQQRLGLPARIKYPFWFDIIIPDPRVNSSAASFTIDANTRGLDELRKSGIPASFPAVTYHLGTDYSFYYFSGDFCDNPVPMSTSYFKGIGFFASFFYNENDLMDRTSFFWKFYNPMLTNILSEYTRTKSN